MKRLWNKDEEDFLRQNYGTKTIKEMASTLNRSADSVGHKIIAMGIATPKKSPAKKWTDKEVQYLESHYEKRGAIPIAKKLNRSVLSVRKKAEKLGLSVTGDMLSVGTLSRMCFSTEPSVVERWIDKFELPYTTANKGYVVSKMIDPEDFWIWAETHKEIIPWHKYAEYSILPEPEWLMDVLKNSGQNRKHRTAVAYHEKAAVVFGRKHGKTWGELAKELNRTEDSIKHIWRNNKDSIFTGQ